MCQGCEFCEVLMGLWREASKIFSRLPPTVLLPVWSPPLSVGGLWLIYTQQNMAKRKGFCSHNENPQSESIQREIILGVPDPIRRVLYKRGAGGQRVWHWSRRCSCCGVYSCKETNSAKKPVSLDRALHRRRDPALADPLVRPCEVLSKAPATLCSDPRPWERRDSRCGLLEPAKFAKVVVICYMA